ncbi:MAG: prephenate dehydrogenase [Acidiferrobacter sp.]
MKPSLAVVGVGLMGASLAAALRRADFVSDIIGVDDNPQSLATAQAHGWIDRGAATLSRGDADIVVLATPVGAMLKLLAAIKPMLSKTTVITDMGSVKQPIAVTAQRLGMRRFIPGHPIAGAERSGPGAARADLFVGRMVILTPAEDHDPEALSTVRALWEAAGAQVLLADAALHDRLVAYTSHLPHLLAFACADLLGEQAQDCDLYPFVGTGLRDFLRIAGSDPLMWRDICAANAPILGPILAAYGERLAAYGHALALGDFDGLHAHFVQARAFRESLNQEADNGEC